MLGYTCHVLDVNVYYRLYYSKASLNDMTIVVGYPNRNKECTSLKHE